MEGDRAPWLLPLPLWQRLTDVDLLRERRRRAAPYLGAHEVVLHRPAAAGVVGRDDEVVGVGNGHCRPRDGEGDVRWGEADGDGGDDGDGG